jgi:hypothetical protein
MLPMHSMTGADAGEYSRNCFRPIHITKDVNMACFMGHRDRGLYGYAGNENKLTFQQHIDVIMEVMMQARARSCLGVSNPYVVGRWNESFHQIGAKREVIHQLKRIN